MNQYTHPNLATERVGAVSTSTVGEQMVCIAYRKTSDIDVTFSDGAVVRTTWRAFQKGWVKHPGVKEDTGLIKLKRQWTGKIGKSAEGENISIYEYINARHVKVQWPDGNITGDWTLQQFLKGRVCHEQYRQKLDSNGRYSKSQNRVGIVKTMRCAMKAECIAYTNCKHIRIRFDNGEEKDTNWQMFDSCKCVPDSMIAKKENRIGEKKIIHGRNAKIVDYTDDQHILVQFEDSDILIHTGYKNWKKGTISPVQQTNAPSVKVGDTKICRNGKKAVVIKYTDCNHITVQYEDGIKVQTTSSLWKSGDVTHPRNKLHDRTGEQRLQKNGVSVVIVQYNGVHDIVVADEKGNQTKTTMERFLAGNVYCEFHSVNVVGKKFYQNCGMWAELEMIESGKKGTILFEDGTRVEHVCLHSLDDGHACHPMLAFPNRKHPKTFHGYEVLRRMFRSSQGTFYLCRKNGEEKILTPQKMMSI